MHAVHAEFMDYKKKDEHTGSDANGQSKNINERENPVFQQISPGTS